MVFKALPVYRNLISNSGLTSSPAAGSISTRRDLTIISIRDLPYDILYIIFTLCWSKEHSPEQPSFPTIASHTCKKWRDHALDTPSFWACLRFDGFRLNLEKYQTWLERSRDYPLDIVFDGTVVCRRKTAKEVLRLIVPSSDRWRSLRICNVPEQVIRIIFDRLLDIPMPTLTELKVVRKYDRYEPDEPTSTKWRFRPFLRGGAPRLESMVIERLSYEYIDARFTNLTSLDILDSDICTTGLPVAPKVHRVLSRLPNLEALRIRAGRNFPRHNYQDSTQTPSPYIIPPLLHNSLKELSIQATSRVKNAVIISLALPEIRYFGDSTRPVREEWEITIGICYLSVIEANRPFPNLMSLRLGGTSMHFRSTQDPRNLGNLDHLEGALGGLQMLRSLTFDQVDWANLQHLHCLSKVCPRLEWLSLVRCTGYTLVDLQSIVERRMMFQGADQALCLAIHGMVGDWRAVQETEAMRWLERETKLLFRPEFRQSEVGWDDEPESSSLLRQNTPMGNLFVSRQN